ncbi:hypothetical protein K2173_028275 [Erythroxylum novogranatense]|uniref:GRF-type domain-containing protein n=1 Tax=Erythroxylum novogranatense TaxID=1862640 RepID=A0AAV8U1N2_9ROSI|nr:hypothetical protein K2173_028275 [Erythroxylum novogranatense]
MMIVDKEGEKKTVSTMMSVMESELPVIRCPCGGGICSVWTSKTEKNPNRKFFCCPSNQRSKGGKSFFKWCDEVAGFRAPHCPCAAGICSLSRDSDKSRWYFSCRIKKGHGACSFFQWADGQLNTLMNEKSYGNACYSSRQSHRLYKRPDNDLGTLKDLNAKVDYECPLAENFEASTDSLMIEQSKPDEIPRLVDCNPDIQEIESFDPVIRGASRLPDRKLQCNVHHRQTVFWRLISAAGDSIDKGVYVHGWLGRLAFSPPHCLKDPPVATFFCCIAPSLDPVTGMEDADIFDAEYLGSPTQSSSEAESNVQLPETPPKVDQVSREVLWKSSRVNSSSSSIQGTNVSDSILKVYGEGLLCILESMNMVDHEKMQNIAEATFETFRRLSLDYEHFAEGVKEFIHLSSKLAQIEGSMGEDLCFEKLIDIYDSKKMLFDNDSGQHKAAVATFEVSENRLKSVKEEV